MERLIEIKTVPIELEMKVNHARLDYKRSTVDLEISRGRLADTKQADQSEY